MDETRIMGRIKAMMEQLDPDNQARVSRWFHDRYPPPIPEPCDPTGAERARRYRERHVTHHVTHHVTVTPPVTRNVTVESPSDPPPSRIPASGVTTSGSNYFRAEAVELLTFLNAKANRSFRPVETTLRPIIARLRSGVSVQDCKGVIVRMIREWKDKPEMGKYLRPETLFNATKFESYLGQNPPETGTES